MPSTGTHDVGPTAQGAGRENLSVAADATTWMDPASASFGRVTAWSSDIGYHHTKQPDRHRSDVQRSTTKFTPGHVRRNGPEHLRCWNLERGRSRDHCPGSVNGPGQRLDDAHGDRQCGRRAPQCRAGSILMVTSTTTCVSRITRKSFRKHRNRK